MLLLICDPEDGVQWQGSLAPVSRTVMLPAMSFGQGHAHLNRILNICVMGLMHNIRQIGLRLARLQICHAFKGLLASCVNGTAKGHGHQICRLEVHSITYL